MKIYNDPKALGQLEAFREGGTFENNPKTQFDFGQTNNGFNPNSGYNFGQTGGLGSGQTSGNANRYDNILPNFNSNQRYF